MFKFLKEKLKGAISKLTKNAEEEPAEEAEAKAEGKEEEIKRLEEEKKALEREEKKIDKEIKKEKKKEKKKKPKKPAKKPVKEKKEAKKEEKAEEEKEEKEKVVEEKKEKPKKEKPVPKEEPKVEEKPKPEEKVVEEKAPEPEEKIKELEKKKEEIIKEEKEIELEEKKAKEEKGFFAKLSEKITKTKVSAENFEKLFWDLEVVLLENNVAVEVIEKIKEDLKKNIVENPIPRGKVEETVVNSLKDSISEVISIEGLDLVKTIKEKKEPYVICFVGVNGSGKTTSIAKVAQYLMDNNLSCVLAASDTFRAAAIDQLQTHADKLKVKLIKHDYGADAAAVAFDAVNHAKAKSVNAVLIDTAGRIHSNANLMDEMKKIVRVAKPDLKVFVGESIVGNDCIEQAKQFDAAVGIDAILLSKADVDEKGGTAISISYVTKKPIIFIGTGQEYKDLKAFEPGIVLESLGL